MKLKDKRNPARLSTFLESVSDGEIDFTTTTASITTSEPTTERFPSLNRDARPPSQYLSRQCLPSPYPPTRRNLCRNTQPMRHEPYRIVSNLGLDVDAEEASGNSRQHCVTTWCWVMGAVQATVIMGLFFYLLYKYSALHENIQKIRNFEEKIQRIMDCLGCFVPLYDRATKPTFDKL